MFQDEGLSMEVIGIGVCSRREMMAGNGERISPEKEKPEFSCVRCVLLVGEGEMSGGPEGRGDEERGKGSYRRLRRRCD